MFNFLFMFNLMWIYSVIFYSYFQRNQTETLNPNLRAKTKPLATSNSKLSNPKIINLRPAKTESTSDLLLSSFSCLPKVWIWEDKGERKRKTERNGIMWVLMKRKGWKTEKENAVLVFKSGLVFFFLETSGLVFLLFLF